MSFANMKASAHAHTERERRARGLAQTGSGASGATENRQQWKRLICELTVFQGEFLTAGLSALTQLSP